MGKDKGQTVFHLLIVVMHAHFTSFMLYEHYNKDNTVVVVVLVVVVVVFVVLLTPIA